MKVTLHIKDEKSEWTETYDEFKISTIEQAEKFGNELVSTYNNRLRAKEIPRYFVRAEIKGESKVFQHAWSKQNSFTRSDHHGNFDIMQCTRCGAIARRYGIGNALKMQKGFTSKKYKTCPITLKN